ncbi:MAG: PEGA domain-containing protein [Deltaproteobacteria bacterium]|nr:PEGA domain-containing protein [Deltaproteobacteria bacterium]
MRDGRLVLGTLVLATTLVGRAAAQTGDQAEAERLFEEGVAAAANGDYATAIFSFDRSNELLPSPGTLKNLALYQDAAGRLADSFRSWSQLLADYGTMVSPATRTEAEGRVRELDAVLARVTIEVNVAGATVLIDGREAGTSPLADMPRVEAGTHVFEARLDGYGDARSTTLLHEGVAATVSLELLPESAPPPVLRVESTTAGATVAVDGGPPQPAPTTQETTPGPHQVRVEAPGHAAETRDVTAPQTGQVVVSVNLVLLEPDPTATVGEEEEGFWDGPWPWVIGGFLVLGAGATATGVLLAPEDEPASDWTLRVR